MSRGGYRPNSGPQRGTKYKPRTPKPEAEAKPKVKAKTKKEPPKKKDIKEKKIRAPREKVAPQSLPDKAPTLPPEDQKKAEALELDPKAYALKIMNDPNEDKTRRDRMCALLLPFCHPRAGEGKGKKEEKEDKAANAGKGKFAPSAPPLKVVK